MLSVCVRIETTERTEGQGGRTHPRESLDARVEMRYFDKDAA